MDADTIGRTIQLILAPVVLVSACGGILIGLLGRYGAINDRLRALVRERLELLGGCKGDLDQLAGLQRERLQEIDIQAPSLLRRHRMMRDALLIMYAAVGVFVVSMFVIALAALAHSDSAAVVALTVFLAGTALMLASALMTLLEVRVSHIAIHYEVQRVIGLGRK